MTPAGWLGCMCTAPPGQDGELGSAGPKCHGSDDQHFLAQERGLAARGGVPQAHGSIPRGRCDARAVRAEGDIVDKVGMAAEHAAPAQEFHVPETNRAIS